MSDTPQWMLNKLQWFQVRELTRVDLFNVKEIPEEIQNLKYLTTLSLSGSFSHIPPWIRNLTQLRALSLSGSFSHIPPEIGYLTQLRTLSLSGSFSHIPSWIGDLPQLTYIHVEGEYSEIPSWIGDLEQLTRLVLRSDVEITLPPPEVIGSGDFADIEAIRQYFADFASENTSPLYEAKLLIIGEPGAGKTTLAVKLLSDDAPMPAPEATTRGIDVDYWEFPLPNDEIFRVNIWDFGGQEIYKATHQFFLTKDSVYALVLDNRKEDDNLIYWLQAVELLSEKSPLIIIKNERDNRARQLNERQLKERFDNIRTIKEVNLGTNQGLPAIKNTIKQYMQDLPHFGTELPQSWVDIRYALEKDNRSYVTYEDYLAICKANNLTDKDKVRIILGYLHNLGVCLHFEGDELLSQYVILKPEWATAAVYAVLDNNDIIKANGVFTLNDLVAIWKQKDYADMRHQLLNLMKKFQLCYAIDDRKFIAPQLLENNQAEYNWDNHENLILRYEYEFMPKGIVSRLIVAMHELIFDNNVWKTGVVLRREIAYAEVKENYKGNEITIRTRGFNHDGLLHTIMYEVEKLHRPFGKQLKVTKNVPCNCSQCAQDVEPQFYEYSFVSGLAERNMFVPCQRSYEMVDARSLLKDVVQIHQPEDESPFGSHFIEENFVETSASTQPVFISYKRKESWQIAEIIYQELTAKGIDVFYDKESLREGNFSKNLTREVVQRDNLIVILVQETLQSDWVVRETKLALDIDNNVVPILIDGLKMEELDIPDEVSELRERNAVNLSQEYLDAAIDKLIGFLK